MDLTKQNLLPRVNARPFEGEDDFWRVRKMLLDTYAITGLDFNWEFRHWDGERFHNAEAWLSQEWCSHIRIWATETGEIAGMAHPDDPGLAFLQIHPDFRQMIEEEMIAWCEENLAATSPGSAQRELAFEVYDYDEPRLRILRKRGYQMENDGMVIRRLRFGRWPLPEVRMDPGYVLRTTRPGDAGDCQRLADLLNAAFNRIFHNAREYRNFTELAPCFRHELNLVAEAADGSFAAHVGVCYEPSIRMGVFEPVCTHPDYRGHGLASTLMYEGLHRMRALGAAEATVGTGLNMAPANALYDAVGFTEVYRGHTWRKVF